MNSSPKEFSSAWFNESSKAWMQGKKKKSNGQYSYICTAKTQKGKECGKTAKGNSRYCGIHSKKASHTRKNRK